MQNGTKRGRIVKVLAVVALAALVFGMEPGRSRAAANGSTYASPTYGFTVTWDDSIWTSDDPPAPNDAEGVQLDSTYSWAMINAVGWPDVDPAACLARMKEVWSKPKTTSDFRMASRALDLPDSPLGGERVLYTMTLHDKNGPEHLVLYTECLPIQGDQAALMVSLITTAEGYDQELPVWSDLLGNVDPRNGSATTTDDAADTANEQGSDVTATTYADPDGYTVAYDATIWTGKPWDDNSGTGIELEGQGSYGYVKSTPSSGAALAECPGEIAYELESNPSFKLVRKASDALARPEVAVGAAGELYTMSASDATNKFVVYIECRALSADSVLLITFFANAPDYATELPVWQQVLDGTQVGDGSSTHHQPAGPASGSLGKQE